MLEGTKKLFPKDYEQFKEAMISAANDNSLPVSLQLDDIRNYTLKDLQDMFSDFIIDTGLEINGSLFFCHDCGKLHLILEICRDKMEDVRMLFVKFCEGRIVTINAGETRGCQVA